MEDTCIGIGIVVENIMLYIHGSSFQRTRYQQVKEKILKDIVNNVNHELKEKATLNYYVERYLNLKKDYWKQSTYTNNKYLWEKFVKNDFGLRKISNITKADIKEWYCKMIDNKMMGIGCLNNLNTLLQCTCDLAIDDDVLIKNPCKGSVTFIKQKYKYQKQKRHALTEEQQSAFLNYLKNSEEYRPWYPIFIVFLGTGCRVGEIIGLRWRDIDFDNKLISINHNTIYSRSEKNNSAHFYMTTPKTSAGVRTIPMLSIVELALYEAKEYQNKMRFIKAPEVEGCSDWVFINTYGNLYRPQNLNRIIKVISEKYNEEELKKAKAENRAPIMLPNFSVHNLRHTFATRFCENETNLKVIQSILGHSDIQTTMDVYAEATEKKKNEGMCKLEGKILLG